MKPIRILLSILLLVSISCTKEYTEKKFGDICIGKLQRENQNDSTWLVNYYSIYNCFIDTLHETSDFSNALTVNIEFTFVQSDSIAPLFNIEKEIPSIFLEIESGTLGETSNVYYYLGFNRYTCQVKERFKEFYGQCICETDTGLVTNYIFQGEGDNADYMMNNFGGFQHYTFFYISDSYAENEDIIDFIEVLQNTLDDIE